MRFNFYQFLVVLKSNMKNYNLFTRTYDARFDYISLKCRTNSNENSFDGVKMSHFDMIKSKWYFKITWVDTSKYLEIRHFNQKKIINLGRYPSIVSMKTELLQNLIRVIKNYSIWKNVIFWQMINKLSKDEKYITIPIAVRKWETGGTTFPFNIDIFFEVEKIIFESEILQKLWIF